jgi:hypothetical protein
MGYYKMDWIDEEIERRLAALKVREKVRAAKRRVICGASDLRPKFPPIGGESLGLI